MRNNSQNAGCILRLPVSHSCQPRIVQWMSAAAAVCESPTASRAARTCSGRGFAAGHFSPRLGWLDIIALGVDFLAGLADDFVGDGLFEVIICRAVAVD